MPLLPTQNTTFSVTYSGNGNTGGNVPSDANTYAQGATVTILGNTGSLVKTGASMRAGTPLQTAPV
jgi:hypothetical protein